MRVLRPLFVALLAIPALAGCGGTTDAALSGGPVAFQAGDCAVYCRQVTLDEVQRRFNAQFAPPIAQAMQQGQTREQITQLIDERALRSQLVEQMVQEELLGIEARRLGLGISPQELDSTLAQDATTASDGAGDLQRLRVDRARSLLALEAAAHLIRTSQYHARVIQVSTENEAKGIVEQLGVGATFADLARQHSQDAASAAAGGELGWLSAGSFAPEVEQVILDPATPLHTPRTVASSNGFYVLEVLERNPSRPFDSLEQLRKDPNAQTLYQNWYQKFRADADTQGRVRLLIDPSMLTIPFP